MKRLDTPIGYPFLALGIVMKRTGLLLLGPAILATPFQQVSAQSTQSRVVVEGNGSVLTQPDLANIAFTVRGEGRSNDEAVAVLVVTRKAIESAVLGLGPGSELRDGKLELQIVRGSDCKNGDDDAPRLSIGPCTINGYIAELPETVRTSAVNDAGTLAGLIGRLKGQNARVTAYELSQPAIASRSALTKAIANARATAETMAQAGSVKLGRVLSISNSYENSGADEVVVTAHRKIPAPALMMTPPIVVSLKPEPIETSARVVVTYEIEG